MEYCGDHQESNLDNMSEKPKWQWQPIPYKKIHKIPILLRQEEERNSNIDVYDPKVVSFGPHHHGKPEFQLCQEAKHLALRVFLNGSHLSVEVFISEILQNITHIRNSYMEESTAEYQDNELAEMMLLDASFLIFFIGLDEKYTELHYSVYNHIGQLVLFLVNRDMFLLENQIPYQVITLLISLRYGDEGIEKVDKFLHKSIWGHYSQHLTTVGQELFQQDQLLYTQLDLFEAFRRVLVYDPSPPTIEDAQQTNEEDAKKRHVTFRSAKDLKAKGIRFKPSPLKSLMGVSFAHGKLQLPTWFVSNLSKVFFPNMIAYELCPNNIVETTVISYVNFMKKLIESPGDVKELRENRILLTSLGSDEEVMRLYIGLNTYGVNDSYSYAEAKQKIQNHYDSKAKTWMAELKHTYLSSPWALIGWFVGAFLLLLTFTQTYYAIYPSK